MVVMDWMAMVRSLVWFVVDMSACRPAFCPVGSNNVLGEESPNPTVFAPVVPGDITSGWTETCGPCNCCVDHDELTCFKTSLITCVLMMFFDFHEVFSFRGTSCTYLRPRATSTKIEPSYCESCFQIYFHYIYNILLFVFALYQGW